MFLFLSNIIGFSFSQILIYIDFEEEGIHLKLRLTI